MKKRMNRGYCVLLAATILTQCVACNNGRNETTSQKESQTQGDTTNVSQEYYDFSNNNSKLIAHDYDAYINSNRDESGKKLYVQSSLTPTICYDNLSLGYLTEDATTYVLQTVEGSGIDSITLSAVDKDYKEVSVDSLVKWDEASMTLRVNPSATADGIVFMDCAAKGEVKCTITVNVTAAYPSNPEYDLNADSIHSDEVKYLWDQNMGGELDENVGVHDPALTEVEIDGVHYYYMVQTGWEGGNTLRRSKDLMHWEYIGKTTPANINESTWSEVENWQLKTAAKCSYWAADIVPASYGGYWLYTCVVSSSVDEEKHDRVSIVLSWSEDLAKNSFQYVGVISQSISDYASDALYYNVVALDPQVVYDNDKMYLTYGSFGAGIYMIELDAATGLRKDGQTGWLSVEEINKHMEDARKCAIGESESYYGEHLTYCAEGSVIAHRYDIPIVNESGEVTEVKDDYYYLMTCLGSLTRNYVLFTAKSDDITHFTNLSGDAMASGWIGKELVTGLFPPFSGYRKDLDRESYITTADRIDGSLEYIAMSSFKWADSDFDIHAPGHGDLYTTATGINIAMLMTRTTLFQDNKMDYCDNGFPIGARSDKFMMQAHQYYTNSVGDIVINANRYAGEPDRAMTKEEFLHFAPDGKFQMVLAGDPYKTTEGIYVTLDADGTISGAATGTWTVYGKNYIKLVVDGYDTYLGCIGTSWLENKNCVGSTVTAMGQTTGCPLYMNSETTK